MKAMLLAAGEGRRMRPLTSHLPKPLVPACGKPLIVYQIERLVKAGVSDIVINVCFQGEKIIEALGDGAQFGVNLHYSIEKDILGTAGGVVAALSQFEDGPFILTSSDIFVEYDYSWLPSDVPEGGAHIVLVDNPSHHPEGDFCLKADGSVTLEDGLKLNYGGIGLYHPRFFADTPAGYSALAELLHPAIARGQVTGEYYQGLWRNVDTPERLRLLESTIAERQYG